MGVRRLSCSVPQRKAVVRYLRDHYSVSERRACRLAKLPQKTNRYTPRRPPQGALRKRIVELAQSRVRYGYKRIHILLKREVKRSAKTGHRVKAVKCPTEMNDDNRNEKETELHGRL